MSDNYYTITLRNSLINKTYCILLMFLAVAACGNNRRPGLSDKDLFALRAVDTLQTSKQIPDFSDMDNYVVPPGIKYTESSAVDPANPPIVIDIANRNLNIRKFNLSDYYAKVRYIKLRHPLPATEGNFLFDARWNNRSVHGGMTLYRGHNSQFKLTDEYIIAGDIFFGFHCYNKEGTFLYTIEANDFPKRYNVSENTVSTNQSDMTGFTSELSIINNCCYYKKNNMLFIYDLSRKERIFSKPFKMNGTFIDANTLVSDVYSPTDTARNFLYVFDIKGDTLCRFPSYNPIAERKGRYFLTPPAGAGYFYNDRFTIRQSMNDTVYRVVLPNRLVPVYVLNFGLYRLDMRTVLTDGQPDKLRPDKWIEADRYILFVYKQGYDSHNNRRDGLVKFFYSYFDKTNRQLYHITAGTTVSENEFLIENPIPDALPFLMSQVDINKNNLFVCYSKNRLGEIIKNKGFSSLPPEQQNRLISFQKELDDSEALIMILE